MTASDPPVCDDQRLVWAKGKPSGFLEVIDDLADVYQVWAHISKPCPDSMEVDNIASTRISEDSPAKMIGDLSLLISAKEIMRIWGISYSAWVTLQWLPYSFLQAWADSLNMKESVHEFEKFLIAAGVKHFQVNDISLNFDSFMEFAVQQLGVDSQAGQGAIQSFKGSLKNLNSRLSVVLMLELLRLRSTPLKWLVEDRLSFETRFCYENPCPLGQDRRYLDFLESNPLRARALMIYANAVPLGIEATSDVEESVFNLWGQGDDSFPLNTLSFLKQSLQLTGARIPKEAYLRERIVIPDLNISLCDADRNAKALAYALEAIGKQMKEKYSGSFLVPEMPSSLDSRLVLKSLQEMQMNGLSDTAVAALTQLGVFDNAIAKRLDGTLDKACSFVEDFGAFLGLLRPVTKIKWTAFKQFWDKIASTDDEWKALTNQEKLSVLLLSANYVGMCVQSVDHPQVDCLLIVPNESLSLKDWFLHLLKSNSIAFSTDLLDIVRVISTWSHKNCNTFKNSIIEKSYRGKTFRVSDLLKYFGTEINHLLPMTFLPLGSVVIDGNTIFKYFESLNPELKIDGINSPIREIVKQLIRQSLFSTGRYNGKELHAILLAAFQLLKISTSKKRKQDTPEELSSLLDSLNRELAGLLPDFLYLYSYIDSNASELEAPPNWMDLLLRCDRLGDLRQAIERGDNFMPLLKRVGLTRQNFTIKAPRFEAAFEAEYFDPGNRIVHSLQHASHSGRREIIQDPTAIHSPCLVVLGPTGVGKSRLFKELAQVNHLVYLSFPCRHGAFPPPSYFGDEIFDPNHNDANSVQIRILLLLLSILHVSKGYLTRAASEFWSAQEVENGGLRSEFWSQVIKEVRIQKDKYVELGIPLSERSVRAAFVSSWENAMNELKHQTRKGIPFFLVFDEVGQFMTNFDQSGISYYVHLRSVLAEQLNWSSVSQSLIFTFISDSSYPVDALNGYQALQGSREGLRALQPFYGISSFDSKLRNPEKFAELSSPAHILSLGRPGFTKFENMQEAVTACQLELLNHRNPSDIAKASQLENLAVTVALTGFQVVLPVEVAQKMVSNHAMIVEYLSEDGNTMRVGYGREPILGISAGYLMRDYAAFSPEKILQGLREELSVSILHSGDLGELLVRFIIMVARVFSVNLTPLEERKPVEWDFQTCSFREFLMSMNRGSVDVLLSAIGSNTELLSKLDLLLEGRVTFSQFCHVLYIPNLNDLLIATKSLQAGQCFSNQRCLDSFFPIFLKQKQNTPVDSNVVGEPVQKPSDPAQVGASIDSVRDEQGKGQRAPGGFRISSNNQFRKSSNGSKLKTRSNMQDDFLNALKPLSSPLLGEQTSELSEDNVTVAMFEVKNRMSISNSVDARIHAAESGILGIPGTKTWDRPSFAFRLELRDEQNTVNSMPFVECDKFRFGLVFRGFNFNNMGGFLAEDVKANLNEQLRLLLEETFDSTKFIGNANTKAAIANNKAMLHRLTADCYVKPEKTLGVEVFSTGRIFGPDTPMQKTRII